MIQRVNRPWIVEGESRCRPLISDFHLCVLIKGIVRVNNKMNMSAFIYSSSVPSAPVAFASNIAKSFCVKPETPTEQLEAI